MTPYQVWLVSRIKLMMERLRSGDRAKEYMSENAHVFRKARFEKLHNIIKEKIS